MAQAPPGSGRCSLVPYELGAGGGMASVSFQGAAIGGVFARFPRALPVHRAGRSRSPWWPGRRRRRGAAWPGWCISLSERPEQLHLHFNQVFQLPCQHVLAALNSDRKASQPEVLSRQRQKGCDAHQAGRDSADGPSEVLKSSWNESLDNSLVVSFLTAEISRLLPHCSGEEFERRYRTLRELADSWIGPYVEVKL